MGFPAVTEADWRAQVEKELSGASFDKTLVTKTAEGLEVQPLYTKASATFRLPPPQRVFRVCSRLDLSAPKEDVLEEILGGADALWISAEREAVDVVMSQPPEQWPFMLIDGRTSVIEKRFSGLAKRPAFAVTSDPFADFARGRNADPVAILSRVAKEANRFEEPSMLVSTLPYHSAGADAADELSFALSTGVVYLEALVDAGSSIEAAAKRLFLQVAVGRDVFTELCKLRALRVCWQKLLMATGAGQAPRALVHAVCSTRTMSQRDPWVNMLRVTTQTFAASLGGADLVTPLAFDELLDEPTALGRRVARNTALVLREESALGKVHDPASGSYFFDSLTDQLAREAWQRFQALERDGGMAQALVNRRIHARLETAWSQRSESIARRKLPVLGVSEHANLEEKLPSAPATTEANAKGLPLRHDSAAFEGLRDRADRAAVKPEAVLLTLGTFAESRPRAGFAATFFAAGGIRVREVTAHSGPVPLVCLCGTDERYAAEAVERARALKAAGCKRIVLAGRPGALEADLRAAGVDTFIFMGCDVLATLDDLLKVFQ